MAACSAKPGSIRPPKVQDGSIRDIRTIPQDLRPFARDAGGNTPLLTPTEQAGKDARFNRVVFGPWELKKAGTSKKDIAALFRNPRGYKRNGARWTKAEWDRMLANADLASYPNSGYNAITVKHANLRELPTSETRFSKPTPDVMKNPFDNFQYSSFPLGTPLHVTHVSRDRRWCFVENPVAGGWISSAEIAPVDDAFIARYRNGKYIAVIKDKITPVTTAGSVGRVHIGSFFPLVRTTAQGFTVMMPVRGADGNAAIAEATLTSEQAVQKPMPLTPNNIARVGNEMMGQPYGWGSMLELRDCSGTTRDLFTPFGIWLPRNSSAQARSGYKQDVSGMTSSYKKTTALQNSVPFMTLVWIPGHIGLYVGKYRGEPVMYHNMWGIRVVRNGDNNARHVVGKCAITTLEPGKELTDRYNNGLLIERIGAYTVLGR